MLMTNLSTFRLGIEYCLCFIMRASGRNGGGRNGGKLRPKRDLVKENLDLIMQKEG